MHTTTVFNDVDVAELYARHRGTVDPGFINEIAEACGPAGALLDVGAGTGDPAAALRARSFDVLCVEPSAEMIAEGRRRHDGLRYVQARGEEIPLSDSSFDAAIAMYVLHHAEAPDELLAECRRLVRPDGRIVVATGDSGCDRQRFFQDYFPTVNPDLPDAAEVTIYARAAGLEVDDIRSVDHWLYPQRTVDEDYIRMVQTQIFAALRDLDPEGFARGISRLRADIGRPIPPSRATLVVLRRQ